MKTNRRFSLGSSGFVRLCSGLLAAAVVSGCHTDMWRQPKTVGQEPNEFFTDQLNVRPPVDGTINWDWKPVAEGERTGRENKKFVAVLPVELTLAGKKVNTHTELESVLRRGKERFAIFCTHCHGVLGNGKGMIAQRGLALRKPPASYHTERLRKMPIGYFFDVMTNGHGVMFPFAYRVKPDDRWAIASYIRVLQASQNVKAMEMSPEEIEKVRSGAVLETEAAHEGGH
jgi:mono/diheme cytochrome c family protein